MNKVSLILTSIVLFCFYQISTAQECDCDILQVSKSGEITNFTKQSGVINDRPFYFSITDPPFEDREDNIVWWNDTARSWMFQNQSGNELWVTWLEVDQDTNCPDFSNIKGWALHPQTNNGEIKSRCLADKNKCPLKKGSCQTVSGPKPYSNCSFPFQLDDVTYNSCTRIRNHDSVLNAWCAVKVDGSGKGIEEEWGNCEPACQPDRCLTNENKCIGTNTHDEGKIRSNESYLISFDARTEAPCVFPFKENNKIYNSCHRGDGDEVAWCATSVDENLEWTNYGFCSESCPKGYIRGNWSTANKNEICDSEILQILKIDPDYKYYTYTKQSEGTSNLTDGLINGRPVFVSTEEDIIYWNNSTNTWTFETYFRAQKRFLPTFQLREKVTHLNFSVNSYNGDPELRIIFEGEDEFINYRCLSYSNKCTALVQQAVYEIDKKSVKTEAKAPCIFPFNTRGGIVNSCTMEDSDGLWCATSVDDDLDVLTWGYCTDTCTFEGQKTCKTDGGPDPDTQCIFPFQFEGRIINSCTCNFSLSCKEDEKPMCPTSLNKSGEFKYGTNTWGYCEADCQSKKSTDGSTTLVVTISTCILLFLLSILVIYYCYNKRNRGNEGLDTTMNENLGKINSGMLLNEQAEHLSYSGKCEIERSKFEIGQKLGGGSYGNVHEGMADDLIHPRQRIKVAIKSVKNPLDPAQIFALISEIKVLDKLERHLNLVNMVGACTSEIKNGRIWLLLEHCSHGDMKNFLLKHRDDIMEGLQNQLPDKSLNMRLIVKWAHNIAKGMEFLASKKIMHGDLAARNILINSIDHETYLAKISDFGLSKAFYDTSAYEKQNRKDIPWKWMSINFLETGTFTLRSDVWSFGVVFWEMLSIGRIPYAGGERKDTINEIKAGFRLPPPDEISQVQWLVECYDEMTNICWHSNPKHRASFSDLVQTLETYLTSEEKENYKRLEQIS